MAPEARGVPLPGCPATPPPPPVRTVAVHMVSETPLPPSVISFPRSPRPGPLSVLFPSSQVSPLFWKNTRWGRHALCNRTQTPAPRRLSCPVILSPRCSRAKKRGSRARSSSQPRPFSKLVSTSVSPSITQEKQTVLPSPVCKTLRGEFPWPFHCQAPGF